MSVKKFLSKGWLTPLIILFVVLTAALVGYLFYQKKMLKELNFQLQDELSKTYTQLESTSIHLNDIIDTLQQDLATTTEERNDLDFALREEKERNEEFSDQIDDLNDTVDVLDKLANTDPELLQKYSKVFFLNEHYEPERLARIDLEHNYDESKEFFLLRDVMPYFERMVDRAKRDDIDLWVVSAYRSFEQQQQLKGEYTVHFGSGANAFSADQGFSEHQLGTTIDFTTRGINGGLDGFENTPAYEWLLDNAHKYGFTLSYPPDNQFYVFEPWHWRFVGQDLARDLKEDDKFFYDLDQREIDKYLVSIFD